MANLSPINMTDAEYEKRMKAARKRAQYELGDPAWAGVIIRAFLHPEEDMVALKRELEYFDQHK